jgi:hypothetical protein
VDLSQASRDARTVLRRALAGEQDQVAGTFAAVVDQHGVAGVYDVAWCLAATTVGDQVRGGWALEFPGIDQAGYDLRWVARFLCAYANDDPATGRALFHTAECDGCLHDCLLALAGSAAATVRQRHQPGFRGGPEQP